MGTLDGDVFHGARKTIRDAIEICGTDSLVHWTGFVADDDLRRLHSGAAALVMPSANEGFGLPAIEAAACGAPVIATTESPLPQLLEGAGIFVRPGDETALVISLALCSLGLTAFVTPAYHMPPFRRVILAPAGSGASAWQSALTSEDA